MPDVASFFKNPKTGEVAVLQIPNAPLIVFFVAAIARRIFHPSGAMGTAVSVIATVALSVWAILEIWRGDSPFRRVLGAIVLAVVVVSALTRLG